MSEPSKIADEALAFLRGFPRPLRIAALVLLLVPLAIFLNGHYGWPHDGLVKDSLWMNCIGSAFIVALLLTLAWYSPRAAMSVAELPESKPVFSESLKYFKEGPELKGLRGDLLKDVQNKFETSAGRNPYELPQEQMQACMVSPWDLDRIVFYLFERYKVKPTLEERLKRVKHEMRLLQTRTWQGSLIPLHYAVESIYPGLFEAGMVPKFSNEQLEPFRKILKKALHSDFASARSVHELARRRNNRQLSRAPTRGTANS
jgi:hypothetical protein